MAKSTIYICIIAVLFCILISTYATLSYEEQSIILKQKIIKLSQRGHIFEESEPIYKQPRVVDLYEDDQSDQQYELYENDEEEYYYAQATVYVVKSGDTLGAIASRNGCTVAQLQSLNGIANANAIYVGQKITLCGGGSSPAPTPTPTPSPSGGSGCTQAQKNGLKSLWGLNAQQMTNVDAICNAMAANGVSNKYYKAYIFATAKWESNILPVEEAFWVSNPTAYRKTLSYYGDHPDGYYGRGYVQLTWKSNYQDWTNRLGVNLVNNPKLALEPQYASQILVKGMLLGTFTGKKLANYETSSGYNYTEARRIINGTDKAANIAALATAAQGIF